MGGREKYDFKILLNHGDLYGWVSNVTNAEENSLTRGIIFASKAKLKKPFGHL